MLEKQEYMCCAHKCLVLTTLFTVNIHIIFMHETAVHLVKTHFSLRYLLSDSTTKTYILYYHGALTFDINYGHLNL